MPADFFWPEVGHALSRARASNALTLQQVQDRTGLSRPTLIRAERGADIQLSTLYSLLDTYGLELSTLQLSAAQAGS